MVNEMAKSMSISIGGEFAGHIRNTIKKCEELNRPFFVVVLQLENLPAFRKHRPDSVLKALYAELFRGVRNAVHSSQYVGFFHDGLGLVFDAVDPGQADNISRRLAVIAQNVLKKGAYNDLTSRWTDIIGQFLWPNKPMVLMPKVGWAIFPRDGATPIDLVRRAVFHSMELNSR